MIGPSPDGAKEGRVAERWGPQDVETAAAALKAGGLVAFPTETVYGLGALASDATAIAALYAAKGRPRFNPLIAHVADLAAARRVAELDETALKLARAFWPGPLTLVGMRAPGAQVCDLATAGWPTVAVRVPAHPLARALLTAVGAPVVAPSANVSGKVSPTTADHVLEGLGDRIAGVLDGGPCPVGVESTIVGVAEGHQVLLRPGGLATDRIELILGRPLLRSEEVGGKPIAPGQLASHYAPGAALRLNAVAPRPGEGWLGFGPEPRPDALHDGPALNLSPSGHLTEAAANLYAHLRALDAMMGGKGVIAIAPIPEEGLGEAIADRLRRAAAPRDPPAEAP
jgi:L-threonylcarbamoyladenylate synthase